MKKRLMTIAGLACAALLLVCGNGCATVPQGGSAAAWEAVSKGAPIRVAVYVDSGSRSKGMFRWLQLMELSPDVKMTPVDGEAIRTGALDNADVLVMPGGRATIEARAMGTNGLNAVRAFVHRGGSYVGTCAGCFMILQYARGDHLCPLVPYMFWRQGGTPAGERGSYLPGGEKEIVFNEKAAAACGISGTHKILYAGGPVLWPTGETIPDAKIDVFANYSSTTKAKVPQGTTIGEAGACLAGTYGKGRIFVLAVHPEANPKNSDVVQGAFRYVTGRNISLPEQQKSEKALRVGFYCAPALGPELAAWAMELVKSPSFHVEPLNHDLLAEGFLRTAKIDVLVVGAPRDVDIQKEHYNSKKAVARTKKYLDEGGKVVVWGPAKDCEAFKTPHANLIVVEDAAAARRALDGMKK